MLPLHTKAILAGPVPSRPLKLLRPTEASLGKWDPRDVVLLVDVKPGDPTQQEVTARGPWAAVLARTALEPGVTGSPIIHSLASPEVISAGDVIRVQSGGAVRVLYRRSSNDNSLFVTGRCNNLCLMCSQPPRKTDDIKGLREVLQVIPLIDGDCPHLGITGGEPTLLGEGLVAILETCKRHLPGTRLHLLTNGRTLADAAFTDSLARVAHPDLVWAVALYGDVAAQHDRVVQSRGAFQETLDGLYNLATHDQSVELRYVVSSPTVGRLPQFAEFVWRNLCFVRHVAIMGLEPTGLAPLNRETLWVDPADCSTELQTAVEYLAARRILVSLYNMPLCTLPESLRPFARQSISDWKKEYAEECGRCVVRGQCCGFFSSTRPEWKSRLIRPVVEGRMGHGAVMG